ncbi:flagellar assembly peptidoglycan hydrolase FlgJ [Algiphilus sp.]|uniref:flagellar assembly peptidoglycan hydrolase FlgJ n=1 Tax=Algiphilus sp. TaxID=1872431 RepID=UPI003B51FAAD
MMHSATPLHTDLSGLSALRHQAARDPDAALHKAAQQFEALLTQQMLSAMRATSFGDDGAGKHGATYRQMLDGQLAQTLASSGRGLGIAEALVAQLRGGRTQGDAMGADNVAMNLPSERVMAQRPAAAEAARAAPPVRAVEGAGARVQAFVDRILPHAERAAAALGVPVRAVIAHAALESGWGAHAPGDNFFGIKAHNGWSGSASQRATLEFDGTVLRPQQESFRNYSGAAAAFGDYVDFLRSNPRYGEALKSSDGAAFLQRVAEAGYATDPDYAQKLERVFRSPLLDAALDDHGRNDGGMRV